MQIGAYFVEKGGGDKAQPENIIGGLGPLTGLLKIRGFLRRIMDEQMICPSPLIILILALDYIKKDN